MVLFKKYININACHLHKTIPMLYTDIFKQIKIYSKLYYAYTLRAVLDPLFMCNSENSDSVIYKIICSA